MKNKIMDGFVFVDRIYKDLNLFCEHPDLSPPVLCFHGSPGLGKSSFAKHWAESTAYDVRYFAMNELDNSTRADRLIGNEGSLAPFLTKDSKPLNRVTILDEFHNLSPKQQDCFKIKLESQGHDERVIICLNTDDRKPLSKSLTAAILSRCYCIDLSVLPDETESFMVQCANHYQHLTLDQIREIGSDQRKMSRENEMARLRASVA